MENPFLIFKRFTGLKDGNRLDLTKYVNEEDFTPMNVVVQK